jgi:hypothetical protein
MNNPSKSEPLRKPITPFAGQVHGCLCWAPTATGEKLGFVTIALCTYSKVRTCSIPQRYVSSSMAFMSTPAERSVGRGAESGHVTTVAERETGEGRADAVREVSFERAALLPIGVRRTGVW